MIKTCAKLATFVVFVPIMVVLVFVSNVGEAADDAYHYLNWNLPRLYR